MDKNYTEEGIIQKMEKDYTRSDYTKEELYYTKKKLYREVTI